ncbi:class I SAM-dependent methyltransferase [Smaragdicoccus niigatensis]|uniref:class I SAM-dependent methyltransferase n=1 Tax=Smaragdicoccus niigatensis TaxID=359359 RepID=UPI00058F5A41|nr:class I SAM-dependent methyltransferase [Smaragdicoccus niigatensis]
MKHVHPNTHDYLPAAGHDAFLPFYDVLTKLLGVGRLHRELIEQARLSNGLAVLEIGCGTGNLSQAAKRSTPGLHVTGTDPDPRAIERARKKTTDITFETAYAQTLPYPTATFDRVLSALMIHHIPEQTRPDVLAEVFRVLKPGGGFHVVDFAGGHGHGHGSINPDAMTTLLEAAGFTVGPVRRTRTIAGQFAFYEAVR